jgi:hypothetical protein
MTVDPFQPYELAGIKLKNRILRSATHEGLADAVFCFRCLYVSSTCNFKVAYMKMVLAWQNN